jgi:hypothetical protein
MKTLWMAATCAGLGLGLVAGCVGDQGSNEDDSSVAVTAEALSSTTYSGRASILGSKILGISVNVADTGPLPSSGGTREVSLVSANVVGLLTADALDAFTTGQNEHTISQSTVANAHLGISVGNITIGANLLAATATAVCSNNAPSLGGSTVITALSINGKSIVVTGAPNQTINLLLGKVIINERTSTLNGASGSIHVAAVHVVVAGLVDVFLSAADAGINCAPPTPPPPPLPTCTDGVKNGGETDVDCGGLTCAPCGIGHTCTGNNDCENGNCDSGVCVLPPPPPPTCVDGLKNGGETDIDCGGPSCAPCGDGNTCLGNADCQSGNCDGVCITPAPSCTDEAKNGQETGVDCGGPECGPCGDGNGCTTDSDCQSGICENGACVAPPPCTPQDYVTGQGYITSVPAPSTKHGIYSIYGENVNGAPTGHVNYDDDGNSEHMKSTDVTSYTITGAHSRQIQGHGTIKNKAGVFTYTANVTDNGNGNDIFTISMSDGYQATGVVASGTIDLFYNACP